MFENPVVALKEKRGVGFARDEDEHRLAKRVLFETSGRGRSQAGDELGAKTLAPDRTARGDLGADRGNGAARRGRCDERVARIGGSHAGAGR